MGASHEAEGESSAFMHNFRILVSALIHELTQKTCYKAKSSIKFISISGKNSIQMRQIVEKVA